MSSRSEKHAVHDTRHMTVHAAAGFRRCGMVRMLLDARGVTLVALQAHSVWLRAVLQRRGILHRVRWMRIVAVPAVNLTALIARGAHQGFSNESCLPESAVLIERAAGKFRQRTAVVPAHEGI